MIDLRFVLPVLIQLRLICARPTQFNNISRKLLIIPTLYFSFTNTKKGDFHDYGPIGFVWAVTLFVASMKSIDLGFTPRSRVRYIGARRERMKESEGDIHKDLGWSTFFELLTK